MRVSPFNDEGIIPELNSFIRSEPWQIFIAVVALRRFIVRNFREIAEARVRSPLFPALTINFHSVMFPPQGTHHFPNPFFCVCEPSNMFESTIIGSEEAKAGSFSTPYRKGARRKSGMGRAIFRIFLLGCRELRTRSQDNSLWDDLRQAGGELFFGKCFSGLLGIRAVRNRKRNFRSCGSGKWNFIDYENFALEGKRKRSESSDPSHGLVLSLETLMSLNSQEMKEDISPYDCWRRGFNCSTRFCLHRTCSRPPPPPAFISIRENFFFYFYDCDIKTNCRQKDRKWHKTSNTHARCLRYRRDMLRLWLEGEWKMPN